MQWYKFSFILCVFKVISIHVGGGIASSKSTELKQPDMSTVYFTMQKYIYACDKNFHIFFILFTYKSFYFLISSCFSFIFYFYLFKLFFICLYLIFYLYSLNFKIYYFSLFFSLFYWGFIFICLIFIHLLIAEAIMNRIPWRLKLIILHVRSYLSL